MARPPIRDQETLLRSYKRRITLLERRLALGGGGGGGGGGVVVQPPLPDPVTCYGSATSYNVDSTAAAWADIDTPFTVVMTVDRPLWVMCEFGAQIVSTNVATYGMIGVQATGALNLEPEAGVDASAGRFGATPFTASTMQVNQSGHKALLLPVGTTTLKLRKRRNTTTVVPVLSYPTLIVTPICWDDVPIPVKPTVGAITRRISAGGQAITTSFITVDWSTPVADSGHFTFDAATDEFTCIVAGSYRITASVGSSAPPSDNTMRVQVQINGVAESESVVRRLTSTGTNASLTTTKGLVIGDKVRVQVLGTAAGGVVDTSNRTYVELVAVAVDSTTADVTNAIQGFVVLAGASQVIPAAATSPNFGAAAYADGMTWDATNDRFVIGTPGWYEIQGNILITPGTAGVGVVFYAAIFVNSVVVPETVARQWPVANLAIGFNVMAQRYLNAGDTVQVVASRGSAATANALNDASLQVRRVRASA